jgi:uncharacterized protein (DUF58 family)
MLSRDSTTTIGWRQNLASLFTGVEREAWIRFLIAIFGLVFAFAAALLSTAAREAGNLIATIVLASSSLLLAGIVGVATVPYLARRVAVRRVRDALNYDVTREGGVYLVFTLLVAIGALNTGNNLLFLVVSAMLGAVLVSGVASAIVLMGIEVGFELPQHVFAKQSYTATVAVKNRRLWVPAFSVSVVPPLRKTVKTQWHWRKSTFTYPKEETGKKPWVTWPDLSLVRIKPSEESAGILRDRVYYPFIPARQTTKTPVQVHFEQRGRVKQDGLSISSRFPFSFLIKTRTVALAREVVVYPPIEQTEDFFEVLPMITGEFETYVRGRGDDLYRIRDYQPEDSARHVDWKSTAKSGTLKVREFTREDERKLRIVFDNPAPGAVKESSYERHIELAASLAWHFAGEQTGLMFVAPGYSGSDSIYDFFEYLADVKPATGESVLDNLQVTDDYNLVFTARPRGTVPTNLWQSSYFVFMND